MDEREAIELLNRIDNRWRERFNTVDDALEALGVNTAEPDELRFTELHFE